MSFIVLIQWRQIYELQNRIAWPYVLNTQVIKFERYFTNFDVSLMLAWQLGNLKEKVFKIACWPKHVFVKQPKAWYASTEYLVSMFSPLKQL